MSGVQKCDSAMRELESTLNDWEPKTMDQEHASNSVAMANPYMPTWRDRVRRWFFPTRRCPLPDAPAHYADTMSIHTTIELSWRDLLRLICSRRAEVSTRTVAENVVGRIVTTSEFQALPPRFLERRPA